ncbi:hypothetical protein F4780DRAFT_391257 [Xylariomycetidae sp. FL0641]|nr:hypothetical protein F4780DRAFT_391257 [Xylariomycetidae sp. FL0641]
MGISLLTLTAATLASLAAALPGHMDARAEAAAATSTVTGYAHPLSFSPLQTRAATASPVTVTTAVTINANKGAVKVADATYPTSFPSNTVGAAAAGAVCTSIGGNYPTTTVPAFCQPARMTNAPSLASSGAAANLATKTISAVSNKLDCCSACAGIANCVAWSFVPVFTQPPTPQLPGGFDPWGRGDCAAVYYYGDAATTEGAASICPNGRVEGLLKGSNNENVEAWDNIYQDGWNQGACGEPQGAFEAGESKGFGDNLCNA